jgi:hypothetical protein
MKPFVNLLPLGYRRRQLVHRLLVKWSLVWITCIVVGVAACGLAWRRSQLLQRDEVAAERSAAPLERLVEEQATMQASLKELEAKGTVLGQVQSERPLLSLLGVVSQSARRCEGRLVVQHLGFERKPKKQTEGSESPQSSGPQKPLPEKDELWGRVTIRGEAMDNVAVATFVVGLRDSGLFRRVELKSCVRSPAGGRGIRSYDLECDI